MQSYRILKGNRIGIEMAGERQRHCILQREPARQTFKNRPSKRKKITDRNSRTHKARTIDRTWIPTIEGGQLGGVGGDEPRGDAAPVAAADDRYPILGVAVVHLRRARFRLRTEECRSTSPAAPGRSKPRSSRSVYIIYRKEIGGGRAERRGISTGNPKNGVACVCFQQCDSGCHFVPSLSRD